MLLDPTKSTKLLPVRQVSQSQDLRPLRRTDSFTWRRFLVRSSLARRKPSRRFQTPFDFSDLVSVIRTSLPASYSVDHRVPAKHFSPRLLQSSSSMIPKL